MAAGFHYRNLKVVSATQDLPVGLCNLVCVESLWMIKVMVAGFFHWVYVLLWAITRLNLIRNNQKFILIVNIVLNWLRGT